MRFRLSAILLASTSLGSCSSKAQFGEVALAAQQTPQIIRDFVERQQHNEGALYSSVHRKEGTFIEVMLPHATPKTEYLFKETGELVERSSPISISDSPRELRSSCDAAIRKEFPDATISQVERVTTYSGDISVDRFDITIHSTQRGSGYFELQFSDQGALTSIEEIPLTAIDTLL